MRKLLAALVLASIFNISTAAHDAEVPIYHLPDSAFYQLPVVLLPVATPQIIIDTQPTVKPTRPPAPKIEPPVIVKVITKPKAKVISTGSFLLDTNVSWYGPGFYGHRTACGLALTTQLVGVANKVLPCGTLITFKWGNRIVVAPVVDRGPYVAGRQFDLTGGLCLALAHCFTGPLYYRIH